MNYFIRFIEWLRGTQGYRVRMTYRHITHTEDFSTYKEAIEWWNKTLELDTSFDAMFLERVNENDTITRLAVIRF